jgi:hypothetical protein
MKAKSTREDLLTALRDGLSVDEACKRAGISKSTYYRWLRISGDDGAWAYQVNSALLEGRISEARTNALKHAGDNSLYTLNRKSKMMHVEGVTWANVRNAYEDLMSNKVNKYSYHLCRAIVDHHNRYLDHLIKGPPDHLKQLDMFKPNLEESHDFYASTLLSHIALHTLVTDFIQDMEEAEEFYRHYEKKDHDPHEIIHMIINIFQYCCLWTDTRPNLIGVFDYTGFRECLKEFKGLDVSNLIDELAQMELYVISEDTH